MKYQLNLKSDLTYLLFFIILILSIIQIVSTEFKINKIQSVLNDEKIFQKINIKNINRFEYLNGREIYGELNLIYNYNKNKISIKKIHPKFNLKKSIDFNNFKFLVNPDFWIFDNIVLEIESLKNINNLIENHLSIFKYFIKDDKRNSLFFRKVKVKINNSNIKFLIFNSLVVKDNRLIVEDLEIIGLDNKNTFIEKLIFFFDIEKEINKIQKINGSNIFLNYDLENSYKFFYQIFTNKNCTHNAIFQEISFRKKQGYGYSSIEKYEC